MRSLFVVLAAALVSAPAWGQNDVSYIADRLAIGDLVVKYAKARDTTDPSLYRQIFAPDATIAIGDKVMSAGLDKILTNVAGDRLRFNPASKAGTTSYGLMRHLVTSVDVNLNGLTASSDYYVVTLVNDPAANIPAIASVARNEDDYVKVSGRWYIHASHIFYGWENGAIGRAMMLGKFTPPQYHH